MKTKNKDEFKILGDIEHILLRNQMYIGSDSLETRNILLDYKYQDVSYVPGLFKIVNELIDNSVDEYVRTEGKFANKIEVTIDDTSFTVQDNGRGIPVEQVTDPDGKKVYKPVAAWTRPRAGSNFSNDSERITAGMNGVGSALSNIFSRKFIGETSDGKKHLVVKCSNNATIDSVKVNASTKKFTRVTIEPDFARFGVNHFDDHFKNMVKDRLVNVSLAYPKIQFKFNGKSCSITPKAYMAKFGDAITHLDSSVALGIMPSEVGEFRAHSVVNGLIIYNGGSHIDYIINALAPLLRDKIKKKHKFDLTPAKIKPHLQLVLAINGFKNPKFDSQSKERITNTNLEVAEHLAHIDYEALSKAIMKSSAIIDPMIKAQLLKQDEDDDKAAREKAKELKGKRVAKHIPASSRIADKKTLFIAEGDSAIGQFVTVRNTETQGAIPLRGKVMNTYGEKPKDILANKELSELMVVIGLTLGKKATNLNYGTIVIMTDQDVDGGSIRGLLINFFYNWPELFEQGRIKILNSPRYILRGKKDRVYFYDKKELESYKGSTKGYELAYIKGLGSLETEEYRDMLSNPYYETVIIDNPELFWMMYGPDPAPRKEFMMV